METSFHILDPSEFIHPPAPAAPAIAAARAAELDIFLAAKRHAAVAAVAGADIDFCLIEKFHALYLWQGRRCGNLQLPAKSRKTAVFSGGSSPCEHHVDRYFPSRDTTLVMRKKAHDTSR